MALHLVGENLDKARGHYRAETGDLVQLMRGIYVDADDDIDATVLRHAVRIANYLYPKAYLSAASAMLLGPTSDGRLFISARRKQRMRIRALEIIQNQAPPHPSIASAVVDDGMGELHINVSSMRQRFLEALRLRSEHAASIDTDMRGEIAKRLIEEYGDPKAAADAVWALARENEWYREGEQAERFLVHRRAVEKVVNKAALNLVVAWHGNPIGHLRHDGFEWRWTPIENASPPLVRQTTPGKLPSFIVSLLPEGWLENILKDQDERALLRSGKRYTSNITIVESEAELATLPPDILLTRLSQYTKDGVFSGRYAGPGQGEIQQRFERALALIYGHADTPRLSGIQIKAPMYLELHGSLQPSTGQPFTHILKPDGTSGDEGLPIVEWIAMALGRAVGLDAPETALIAKPDDLPPALIVERFDIRQGPDDRRMLAMEDMCSVLDLPKEAKYDSTMERVARAIRPLSTAPEEDLIILIKRTLFAWLIADGDMHLKNMALLKMAHSGDRQFRTVRIAPLYDAVTTRVFPRLQNDRLALKLNGRDDNLHRADFRALATTAGLKASDADDAINEMLQKMPRALDRIALPTGLDYGKNGQARIEEMADICRSRLQTLQ